MATVWLIDLVDPLLESSLRASGHLVESAKLARLLALGADASPDVAFIRSGDSPPIPLARRASLNARATACVILIPPDATQQAEAVLEAGAADVGIEPLDPKAAALMIIRVLRQQRIQARLGYIDEKAARGAQIEDVVTSHPGMKELLDRMARISKRSALGPALSVLLNGETGTGKGLFARVLHFSSRRRDAPFIEVNCAALPASLLEAELFGYEKGAFTDAKASRVGLLEAAHGGTIFLDEISHLNLEGQAKLLTALETRRVRRLGGTSEREVNVQVLAASSHDLPKLVSEGNFRAELLHRLTSLWFKLPPLRERGDDCVLLAEQFLAKVAHEYDLPLKRLSNAARRAIRGHSWPGNVRELYHAIERAILSEEGDLVEPAHLALHATTGAPAAGNGSLPIELPSAGIGLEAVERCLIERALEREKGNVTRAAALLKVTRDTLRSRVEKFGISPKQFTG